MSDIKLTKEQMEALRPYESYMRTAVRARWASNPGMQGIDTLRRVWEEATGSRRNMTTSCGVCILNLLEDVGRLYFGSIPKRKRRAV